MDVTVDIPGDDTLFTSGGHHLVKVADILSHARDLIQNIDNQEDTIYAAPVDTQVRFKK